MEMDPFLVMDAAGPRKMPSQTSAPDSINHHHNTNNNNNMQQSQTMSSSSAADGRMGTSTGESSSVPSSSGAANNSSSSNNIAKAPSSGGASEQRLGEACTALAMLLQSGHIDQQHVSTVQGLIRENSMLKEKIAKLKSLLGRSAKAQKDAKLELVGAKKKLDESNRVIESLNERVEQLANRPTHYLDLVADFESNFDRALLAIETNHQQQEPTEQQTEEQVQQQQQHQQSGEESSSSLPASATTPALTTSEDVIMEADHNTAAAPHVAEDEAVVTTPDGNDPSTPVTITSADAVDGSCHQDMTNNSNLLVSELDEARAQIAKLESLQSALMQRAAKLEKTNEELTERQTRAETERDAMFQDLTHSRAEAESARLAMKEKAASLAEMQLEIDLVTKASVDANARANNTMLQAQNVRSDKKYVGDLESKVNALTEWALASAEAKTLAVERNKELERKLKALQLRAAEGTLGPAGSTTPSTSGSGGATGSTATDGDGDKDTSSVILSDRPESAKGKSGERKLWVESSSMVVGAGMAGSHLAVLGQETQEGLKSNEIVLLRWKFDLTPSDLDIVFSILKGGAGDNPGERPPPRKKIEDSDFIIQKRHVRGGAGGEVEGAFAVQNSCTLVFDNKGSWVRPRTVKFTLEVIAVK